MEQIRQRLGGAASPSPPSLIRVPNQVQLESEGFALSPVTQSPVNNNTNTNNPPPPPPPPPPPSFCPSLFPLSSSSNELADSLSPLPNSWVSPVGPVTPVDDRLFLDIVNEVRLAIKDGVYPERIQKGSSGSYFCKNRDGKIVGVFKPKNEEPYGTMNPKWTKWFQKTCLPCCFGRSCLVNGAGYLSEACASYIDRRLGLGVVPRTEVVLLASPTFFYTWYEKWLYVRGIRPLPLKVGSFQLFLNGFKDATTFFKDGYDAALQTTNAPLSESTLLRSDSDVSLSSPAHPCNWSPKTQLEFQASASSPSSKDAPPNFLNLDRIRHELVQMEDTIVFALIERAGFAQNLCIYSEQHENFEGLPFNGSFLDYLMAEMEAVHAKVRRYTSPDEYPFSKDLPEPILPPLTFPRLLYPNDINLNATLKKIYIEKVIPSLCKDRDDKNYGSATTKDIEALQILSRRIHFGKFVAEAKFQDMKLQAEYIRLIEAKDRDGIEALLTNRAVEERLLKRLRLKASIYGQEIDETITGSDMAKAMDESSWRSQSDLTLVDGDEGKKKVKKIDPDLVVRIYEQFVIPLTKEVEVEYLLGRLEHYPSFVPSV